MKINLTTDQADLIITALEWAKNEDYPKSDPVNMRFQRLIDKIKKETK